VKVRVSLMTLAKCFDSIGVDGWLGFLRNDDERDASSKTFNDLSSDLKGSRWARHKCFNGDTSTITTQKAIGEH